MLLQLSFSQEANLSLHQAGFTPLPLPNKPSCKAIPLPYSPLQSHGHKNSHLWFIYFFSSPMGMLLFGSYTQSHRAGYTQAAPACCDSLAKPPQHPQRGNFWHVSVTRAERRQCDSTNIWKVSNLFPSGIMFLNMLIIGGEFCGKYYFYRIFITNYQVPKTVLENYSYQNLKLKNTYLNKIKNPYQHKFNWIILFF